MIAYLKIQRQPVSLREKLQAIGYLEREISINGLFQDPTCCAYIRTWWTTYSSRFMKEYVEAILGVDPWLTEQCRRVISGCICRMMLFSMLENVINARDLLRKFTNLLESLIRYQSSGLLPSGAWILWAPFLGRQEVRSF